MDSAGFAKFKQQRAAKAAATPTIDDQDYAAFVSSMTGQAAERDAGVATTGMPGGREVPDDLDENEVYEAYRDVLSGEAARRQAEATARREKAEREQEIIRHLKIAGGGTSRDHDHLRDRLKDHGF